MGLGKAKLLGSYALQSALFYVKRKTASIPPRIDTIVVDIDYTLLDVLTPYRALEKILGPEGARQAYAEQKARVKSGKANFADVKHWGHELQKSHGWTARDWKEIVDRAYGEGIFNWGVIGALQQIKRENPGVKIVLTTGTSDILGKRLAAHLRGRFGLRVDAVVGSKQTFDRGARAGKVSGLEYFVGETHTSIPAVEKIPAIKSHFGRKGWSFNPKTTMAISDADPQLLRKCGIGVLVKVGRGEDPASFISQKFKLRDVEYVRGQSPQFLVDLALHPRGKNTQKKSVRPPSRFRRIIPRWPHRRR
ncbi:MAG: hypothetical protein Q8P05_05285 [Candidatus Diapherotrites archaeon]|nr:hypothetical protein [Candidatus Diapherotrites archaeon]MDZ4256039.1 hypothetical protein [archaeon]